MKKNLNKINFNAQYNSTIFTDIYRNNRWGGKKGDFYSGPGSHTYFIKGYIDVLADFIVGSNSTNIVEIGCGDFNVSSAVLQKLSDQKFEFDYTGYDVVKPLIEKNKATFSTPQIGFVCKDSCTGKIKSGDILIIRQVLQHLNNKSIQQIATKFKDYKYIVVTEHQASEKYGDMIVANKDHKTGASIRLQFRSGVYLDKAPFNCKIDRLLYSIPQPIFRLEASINTFLISNENGLHQ